MLKIHTRDGRTTKVDLTDADQAREWMRRWSDPRFQAQITGMTIADQGVQYSISRPDDFGAVSFRAEHIDVDLDRRIKGGERITCMADDARVTVMVHSGQRAVKVSLLKFGKQRFIPGHDPLKGG